MERGAAPNRAAGPDAPALHLNQPLDDRQAQPAAAGLAGARLVGAVEALEDLRQLIGWDARASGGDLEHDQGRRMNDQGGRVTFVFRLSSFVICGSSGAHRYTG